MARPDNDTRGQPLNSVSPYRRNTADRKRIADAIGERDEGFLMELQSAGYTAETIVLAELIPQTSSPPFSFREPSSTSS